MLAGLVEAQVRAIEADDRYSDETLQQEILLSGLADLEALDRILVRKLAAILDQFVCFVRGGDEECQSDSINPCFVSATGLQSARMALVVVARVHKACH